MKAWVRVAFLQPQMIYYACDCYAVVSLLTLADAKAVRLSEI